MKDILKFLKNNIFVITLVFIVIATTTIIISTFATDTSNISNADISYTFTLGENNLQNYTVNAGESKLIEFKIKNTNNHSVKYGLIYQVMDNENVTVKEVSYSKNHVVDTIEENKIKIVSVEINNTSDINQTFIFNTILGYEKAGDLSIPEGYQLVEGNKLIDYRGTSDFSINTIRSSLKDFRIYGNMELKNLPDEYMQVDYILNNSYSYLDTKYIPRFTSKIEMDAQIMLIDDNFTAGYYFLFGCRSDVDDSKSWFELINNVTTNTWTYHNGNHTNVNTLVADTERHMFTLDGYNKSGYIDDTLVATFEDTGVVNNNTTLHLFASDYGEWGIYQGRSTKVKLFGCKIYDNNNLIRDYVPSYRISDGVIGLYDLANNVFYEIYDKSGYLKSEKGSDISKLSVSEYRGVEDITINKTGTNLFDGEWEYGNIHTGDGTLYNSTYIVRTTDFVEVEANEKYKFTSSAFTSGGVMMFYYDQNMNFISSKNVGLTFTTPKGCKYIKFRIYAEDRANAPGLISGEFTTKLEKYPGSKSYNLNLSEPLRKIGKYADYIDYKNKRVVRYIKKIDSYRNEKVTEEYISSTGELSIGALVYYVMEIPSVASLDIPEIEVANDTTNFEITSSIPYSDFRMSYYGL